jgi:DNA-binding protein YbaB
MKDLLNDALKDAKKKAEKKLRGQMADLGLGDLL